jgi:hypothetical protein
VRVLGVETAPVLLSIGKPDDVPPNTTSSHPVHTLAA